MNAGRLIVIDCKAGIPCGEDGLGAQPHQNANPAVN